MKRTSRAVLMFLVWSLVSSIPPVFAQADAGFEGRWEGAILFKEGQIELDMVARLQQRSEGGWEAVVSLPVVGVVDHPTQDVEIDGNQLVLRFTLQDTQQVLTGHLDDGETVIEGTFQRGDQPSSPVYLERRDAPENRPTVEVADLSGAEELKRRFNEDRGNVRLVLLLAPT